MKEMILIVFGLLFFSGYNVGVFKTNIFQYLHDYKSKTIEIQKEKVDFIAQDKVFNQTIFFTNINGAHQKIYATKLDKLTEDRTAYTIKKPSELVINAGKFYDKLFAKQDSVMNNYLQNFISNRIINLMTNYSISDYIDEYSGNIRIISPNDRKFSLLKGQAITYYIDDVGYRVTKDNMTMLVLKDSSAIKFDSFDTELCNNKECKIINN